MALREMAPGTVFAGHRIESVVGRGGMGVVYRATQLDLERSIALKVIAPELLDDAAIRERFLREAKAAASIDHPNVIPLHYAGEHDGIAYIAMRFVDGDDVRTLVRRSGALAPERAARIAAQVAAALDAIHAGGFVHRDIKPANVLLGEGDHVYVTDFGLVKHALSRDGATRTGQWVGTLDYVSPEQIRGGRVDARADVYALGGVLHYMLTATVPYRRDGDEAKLWAHLSEPPPAPSSLRPELPTEFDAVVARAMAKDADDRYPSAGDLGRAALAAARGRAADEPERMVARGAAAPEGAESDPAIESPTVTGTGPTIGTTAREAMTAAGATEVQTPVGSGRPAESRRRRAGLAAALLVLVAGAVAAIVGLSGGGDDDPKTAGATPTPTPTATAAKSQLKVEGTVEDVGRRPSGVAIANGGVWVSSSRQDRLTRVDAKSRKQRDGPRIGRLPSDIEADDDVLWVAASRSRSVARVETRGRGRVTRTIQLDQAPTSLALTPTTVWVATRTPVAGGPDGLLRFNRSTGEQLGRTDFAEGITSIAIGGNALWISSRRGSAVRKLSRATGELQGKARVSGRAFGMAYGAGYLWATIPDADTVERIDPRTLDVVHIAVGNNPSGIAVADGRVFVACQTDNTLVEIDAETARRAGDPLDVGLNPFAVAAADGSAWVTGLGDDSLTEVRYG